MAVGTRSGTSIEYIPTAALSLGTLLNATKVITSDRPLLAITLTSTSISPCTAVVLVDINASCAPVNGPIRPLV
jgi:hypothetical protein